MTFAEKRYRDVALRIAFAMLIFYGLSLVEGVVLVIASLFTLSMSALAAEVVTELIGALLYAAVFVLPIFFFKMMAGQTPVAPMRLSLSLPRDTWLYVFFGVAANSALAYFNAQIVSVFDYADFSSEVLWQSDVTSNYQLVLMFITLAVVPAFVEELLFRGLVLENLLPFGRSTAILGSAFLFGLMHQNAEQFLYATLSGAVLGWIYVSTRSIWPCVLMHLFNNFQAVLQTAVQERLPRATADGILYLMEGGILLAGIAAAFLLFRKEKGKEAVAAKGAFETELAPSAEFARYPIPLSRRVRLFFNVPMIIFVALCAVNMVILILTALLLY